METLYTKLYDKYIKLKVIVFYFGFGFNFMEIYPFFFMELQKEKDTAMENLNRDQEKKFMNYVIGMCVVFLYLDLTCYVYTSHSILGNS